jgi:Uma2 family endonuclease
MATTPTSAVPMLESGDRMTREEFHRIYEMSPQLKHVELIEGVVYMPSPISFERHSEYQGLVLAWLGAYAANHPEVRFGGPASVFLDRDNEPEPDAVMVRRAGGTAQMDPRGYIVGVPELAVEIAATSRTIDLGEKFRAYRRNGLQEYIVWITSESRLFWFSLEEGDYVELPQTEDGVIESRAFPGLRLKVRSLVELDTAALVKSQLGL